MCYFFLERLPFVTVEQVDDATILVAMPLQAFAHDDIGLVCVDADVGDLSLTIIQDGIQDTV